MLSPKYERAAARIKQLIDEGGKIAALEKPSSVGPYIQEPVPLHAWAVRVDNIVRSVFGAGSVHYLHLQKVMDRSVQHAYEVHRVLGILAGALDDLEGGYLTAQEMLIAGVVFDSILEQATHLLSSGYKDPAAVLGRVVLEDALRRLASTAGLDSTAKAATINDSLRDQGRYAKPQWRLVQSWLDIGNAAAHGKFDEYTDEGVRRMLEDIARFWAQQITP